MLEKSNFTIRFGPISRKSSDSFAISVEITPEFYKFLKKQKPRKELYEQIGYDTLKKVGHASIDKKFVSHNFMDSTICSWEGGLLTKIQAPGNAAGLFFEESPYLKYHTHNIFSQSQTSMILAIMTRYLFDMEAWIPLEK